MNEAPPKKPVESHFGFLIVLYYAWFCLALYVYIDANVHTQL